MTESKPIGEVDQTGVAAVAKALESIRELSAKKLVEYAKKEFDQDLNTNNGRRWLVKKVGYLIQAKLRPAVPNVVKERAKELDNPEVVAKYKKQDAKELADSVKDKMSKEPTMKTAKAKEKKVSIDEDGFRIGSKGSEIFKLLKKGTTFNKLDEIGGAAVKGFLSGIVQPLNIQWPAAREAKIEKDEKKIRILQYKTRDGKLHKIV
ncbi:MAG: hypothetical protein ABIG95_02595 [Candidatus Woesearchaeota archaeon]